MPEQKPFVYSRVYSPVHSPAAALLFFAFLLISPLCKSSAAPLSEATIQQRPLFQLRPLSSPNSRQQKAAKRAPVSPRSDAERSRRPAVTRTSSPSAVVLLLATDGKANLPIVVGEKASASTKAVAAELALSLKRISGATFEVRTGNGSRGIVIGSLRDFPVPVLSTALQIRKSFDGKESYAIRTQPHRLLLLGATDAGASHAVFRFLEILGYRWFFPAKEWEVVPPVRRRLTFNTDETDRPTILARRIWYGYGFFSGGGPTPQEPRAQLEYSAWSRHNRMGSSFGINAGHAWQEIIANNKAEFEAHPEYLALVSGKRQGEQLCVSNPAVRKMARDYALGYFRRNPASDMVSMEPSDGGGQCECESCKQLGSISDRVFGLANEVAKAIAGRYPGKMVGLYAYNEHCEPPRFKLEPNVYVQLTAGFITGRYSFEELLKLWPQRSRNMGFYDYFSVWLWDFDRLPGGRAANLTYLRNQIQRYAARGATSIDAESGNNWGPHGRGYYIANRLMWDPNTDVEALLTDFYEKAFGPGAPAMRRYYERLAPDNKPLLSRHLLGLAFRDVAEATRAAQHRPDVLARLDHLKQYLRYTQLNWKLEREPDRQRRKDLTLQVLTHSYRTRFSYMNHWEAMRQDMTVKAAKEFNEPTWSHADPTPKPWSTRESTYTHEETDRAFQEGLTYFQPQPVTEKRFSSDLVPVQLEGSSTPDKAAVSLQHYQGGVRYALFSARGEPLELEIVPGTIAWYRDRADAKYTLRTAVGEKKVGEGRLKLDGERHRLLFKGPKPGLYYFDFDDSAAGWTIRAAPGQPVSLPLLRDRGFLHQGWMQRMYFYVPKGVRSIAYYWAGGPHKVLGPSGTVVQEVKTSGEFVVISVPSGMDGRAWSFSEIALGHLWFFNIPNQVAASPNALLLPREVAKADGLLRHP